VLRVDEKAAPEKKGEAEKPEEEVLEEGVRRIVLSRETIPRDPRWASAFRETLFRFVREIAGEKQPPLDEGEAEKPEEEDTTHDR
jgi:hypothetical protein